MPLTPRQVGNLTDFSAVLAWTLTGDINDVSVITEFVLSTQSGVDTDLTTRFQVRLLLHRSSDTSNWLGLQTLIGQYQDPQLRTWDVYDAGLLANGARYYVFVPQAGDVSSGTLDYRGFLGWLRTGKLIPDQLWVNGVSIGTQTDRGANRFTLTDWTATLQGSGAVLQALRTVPSSIVGANTAYVVARSERDGQIRATKFSRNAGLSGGTDLGFKWPEWRVTGTFTLNAYGDDPTVPAAIFTNSVNSAFEYVGNNGSSSFGSAHGLGSAGSLNSESVLVGGVAIDLAVDAVEGASFQLTNDTTAVFGGSSLQRQLRTSITETGGLRYEVLASTTVAMNYVRTGMPRGEGPDFNEADFRFSTSYTPAHLGTGYCQGVLRAVNGVRLRDPATGRFITASGNLPVRAGFAYAEVYKEPGPNRSTIYLARFTAYSALTGSEWFVDWGIGASGSRAMPASMLVNGDFSSGNLTGWQQVSGSGTVAYNAGMMRQTREAAAQNRVRQTAALTLDTTKVYAYMADLVALSGGSVPNLRVATSSGLGTNVTAQNMPAAPGRLIMTYQPGFTSMYVGNELGPGTAGQTMDTDNYRFYQLAP